VVSSLSLIKAAHWRDGIRSTALGAMGEERTARQRRVILVKGFASRGADPESKIGHEHRAEGNQQTPNTERRTV
jgi:hypothetical protein